MSFIKCIISTIIILLKWVRACDLTLKNLVFAVTVSDSQVNMTINPLRGKNILDS